MVVRKKPPKRPTVKKKTARKKPPIPQSSDAKAARQAIIQADLLGIEADRARLAELSKGSYGGMALRSGGSSIARYRIGKPKADKGYGKPPPKPRTVKRKAKR